MKIKELVIHNFMPYKGEQRVVFPQHDTQNVMLLFGDNMRGKTSFLNAIRWGFYGVAVGRHLRAIPRMNLINIDAADENDWNMEVMLQFCNQDRHYELRRRIRKKAHVSRAKNDADFEESIHLKIDGEPQNGDLIIRQINQVIPEEISRFFLFDGELLQEYENLLIEESEQGEKIKEHIEQALGVPALIHGREELSVLLKQARRTQAQDAKKTTDLKSLAEQQRQLEFKMESFEKDLMDLKAQREQMQTHVDDIDDTLKDTEAAQRKKTEIDSLEEKKRIAEKQLKEVAEEQRELLRNAWKDVLHSSVAPMLSSLKQRRNTLQNSLSNKAIIEAKIKELTASLDEPICPTCKQIIPVENKHTIEEQIAEYQAEAELSVVNPQDMGELNRKIDNLSRVQSSDERSRILSCLEKQRKLQVQLVRIETDLDELHEEIKGFDTDQIMRQREKRDQLIIQLGRLGHDIDRCKSEIEKNTKEQDHIAKLISKSAGAQGQLSSIRVNVYQELEEIFAKGVDYLRDSLREQVAAHASKAFAELTTEKTYSGLQINKSYGLSILDHEGRVLKERSAGAEQIVALSLIDGLNRTARKSGPIVMDTPLGRLDTKHRGNVLKYLPKMAEQVVLLVHEGEIDPNKDLQNFADRIGARYKIKRVSATQSMIQKSE